MIPKLQQKFSATLYNEEHEAIASGYANVSFEEQSVNFVSDFVPLYKMGTELTVIQTHNQYEVARYTGKVYLSSSELLRLVSVQHEILPGAGYAFLYPVSLEGTISGFVKNMKSSKGFFSLFRKKKPQSEFPVKLTALSCNRLRFSSEESIEQGQMIRLSLAEPKLDQVLLKVEHFIQFGEHENNYRCEIMDMDPQSRERLNTYVHDLSQREKAIPPEPGS